MKKEMKGEVNIYDKALHLMQTMHGKGFCLDKDLIKSLANSFIQMGKLDKAGEVAKLFKSVSLKKALSDRISSLREVEEKKFEVGK